MKDDNPWKTVPVLVLLIAVTEALPALVQVLNSDGWTTWDAQLLKPWWQPPGWAFGVVWPSLYLLMAIAAWLVWRRSGWRDARWPLTLYGLQLVVNSLWTWVYLGLQSLWGAFFWICGLWLLVLATAILFSRRSRAAGWLLVPYLMWITFAGALSFTIWRLNTV